MRVNTLIFNVYQNYFYTVLMYILLINMVAVLKTLFEAILLKALDLLHLTSHML